MFALAVEVKLGFALVLFSLEGWRYSLSRFHSLIVLLEDVILLVVPLALEQLTANYHRPTNYLFLILFYFKILLWLFVFNRTETERLYHHILVLLRIARRVLEVLGCLNMHELWDLYV
jgi:hypothetical protein